MKKILILIIIFLSIASNISAGSITMMGGGTTPSLSTEGSTVDGYVYGGSSTYSTAHSTSTAYDVTDTIASVGQYRSGSTRYIYRGFLKFDTSSIPDNATITSVTLTLTAKDDGSTTNFDVVIKKANWSANDPIDSAGDREGAYDICHDATADSNIWRNTNGMNVDTNYTSGTLDTTWVSKTGSTYYCLMSSLDISETDVSDSQYINIYTQEATTQSYRPKLVVGYIY